MWQAHRERRRRTKQANQAAKLDESNPAASPVSIAEAITEEPASCTSPARVPSIASEGKSKYTI